jgi:methionine-S-sulfoxide reductase
MEGVWRTRVGYAGGQKKNPTYQDLGDHTESFQVDFDPAVTSYEKLLEVFWDSHNPCAGNASRQYMSAVFYANEKQKKAAEASKAEIEKRGRRVVTPILPVGEFTVAEDYHQKWNLRQRKAIAKELLAVYPKAEDLMNSTAAMKLNAYLGGEGSAKTLAEEIGKLGLSEAAQKALKSEVADE